MVKDEADVIEGVLRHMADEVDRIVVADNLSTDDSRKILDELAEQLPLTIVDDADPAYYQSAKMTRLAEYAAREHDATWIVPFDADELWVFKGDRISVELAASNADVVHADLFHHFPTAVDPEGDDPFRTIIWRQPHPAPLPKVAFRWREGAVIEQGNHGVDLGTPVHIGGGLEVRHFPYRTVEQFTRKAVNGAAAYKATELPEHVGAHWRGYGALLERYGETALHDVFREHFWALSPADKGWIPDAAPYRRWA